MKFDFSVSFFSSIAGVIFVIFRGRTTLNYVFLRSDFKQSLCPAFSLGLLNSLKMIDDYFLEFHAFSCH